MLEVRVRGTGMPQSRKNSMRVCRYVTSVVSPVYAVSRRSSFVEEIAGIKRASDTLEPRAAAKRSKIC